MKEEKYLIVLVILLSLTVISTSFAYFVPNIIRENINDTKVESGVVKVSITDASVNAVNLAPIYDKDSTKLGFKKEFSIVSSSTLNTCNKIYLNIDSISSSLKSEYLKYKLVNNNSNIEINGNFINAVENEKLLLLDNVFLNNNETQDYTLYIWLSYQENIDQLDMLGTTIKAKLSIESLDAKNKNSCTLE